MIHRAAKLAGRAPSPAGAAAFLYQATCGARFTAPVFDLAGEDVQIGDDDEPCPRCLPHLAARGLDAAGTGDAEAGEDDSGMGALETEGEDQVLATEVSGEDEVLHEEVAERPDRATHER